MGSVSDSEAPRTSLDANSAKYKTYDENPPNGNYGRDGDFIRKKVNIFLAAIGSNFTKHLDDTIQVSGLIGYYDEINSVAQK